MSISLGRECPFNPSIEEERGQPFKEALFNPFSPQNQEGKWDVHMNPLYLFKHLLLNINHNIKIQLRSHALLRLRVRVFTYHLKKD